MRGSLERARTELAERLRERRGEIERALITRVYAIADPAEAADPTYAEGLRMAVGAAIDYGLAGINRGQARPPSHPAARVALPRVAARNGVTLDTVLRRYFAGYTLFGDFLMGEAQGDHGVSAAELKRLLLTQAANFDRLVTTVTEEHISESTARFDSVDQRRAHLVQRLLLGELVEVSELAAELRYDFHSHNVGLVVSGSDVSQALRKLSTRLDCRLLLVHPHSGTVWAWLGGRLLNSAELAPLIVSALPEHAAVAIGEPAEGLFGWRLSHRQAVAALPIAQRGPEPIVRYADTALIASVLQDDLLATSLRRLYIEPLERERDGGVSAKKTLRAYFEAAGNISSAAAALAVHRDTVGNRLRVIEAMIGRPPDACAADLELALRLDDLARPA